MSLKTFLVNLFILSDNYRGIYRIQYNVKGNRVLKRIKRKYVEK